MWDSQLFQNVFKENKVMTTVENFKEVYIGHTATPKYGHTKPIIKNGFIAMDTGSGKGGLLTMMNVETKEIFQN